MSDKARETMNEGFSMAAAKLLLMEQLSALWRYRWLALAVAWLVCLVGWAVVAAMPRYYQSSARAYVDVNGLLTPILKGLVIDNGAVQNAGYLRQTLLSRPNLEQVIALAQLDTGLNQVEKEELFEHLSSTLIVNGLATSNLFGISYRSLNPEEAKNVVEALITIFAEKSSASNRVEIEKATQFLDEQIAAYEEQLRAAEKRRSDFRKEYAEAFADPITGAPKISILGQEVTTARAAYGQAVATRDSLQAQLKRIPAGAVVGADGRVNSLSARLEQANATLANLRLKYTEKHPDVIAVRAMIAEVQGQLEESIADAESSEDPLAKVEVVNPAYEQVRFKLIDAETAISAASQRLGQATANFEKLRAVGGQVPDVDLRVKDLDRDYDIIRTNHAALLARRESTNLSQAADNQADRTQFRIVDAPQVPLVPFSPNLPAMFTLVLLAGIGAGVAFPIGIELIRATFSSASRLRSLGLPVIGTVTYVQTPGSKRAFIVGAACVATASAALVAIYGALMILGDGRGIV